MTAPDEDVFTRTSGLVEEEHRMRGGADVGASRLRQLEEHLDVEHYQQ
jgi:hypothetical protein